MQYAETNRTGWTVKHIELQQLKDQTSTLSVAKLSEAHCQQVVIDFGLRDPHQTNR